MSGAVRRCVDSGVIVAAFASWHERHDTARQVMREPVEVAAHSLVESYSVLTRMPAPFRAPPQVVFTFLADRFAGPALELPAAATLTLLGVLSQQSVVGGAVYDALIGATAISGGCVLVTFDERAARSYQAVGCPFQLL